MTMNESLEVKSAKNKFTEKMAPQAGESTISITRTMFDNYRRVQHGGEWNMMMEWQEACYDAELSDLAYWSIIQNYTKLAEYFGDYDDEEEEY